MTQYWGKVEGNLNKYSRKISGDISQKSRLVQGAIGVNSGISGTKDYEKLYNKPRIEDVELIGNKTLPEIGVGRITNFEIESIISD